MSSKKAVTLIVLAITILSLVLIPPVKAAIQVISIGGTGPGNTVQKSDELIVIGEDVTAGATVNLYWDNAFKETFSSGSGKVASTTSHSDGTWIAMFEVPEAIAGAHYIWAKDVSTGQTYGGISAGINSEVMVISKLLVDPDSGFNGDAVSLIGYGYGYDSDDEKGLDVTLKFLDSYLGDLDISFTPTTPKTSSLGTFTAAFTVPDVDYGYYVITAEDEYSNDAFTTLKIGAFITLSTNEDPVGSVVTITGRGFDEAEEFTVTIDGKPCYIVSGDTVLYDGSINTEIIIPSVDVGAYTITVKDELGGPMDQNVAEAYFEVNGVAVVKATPSYGVQGAVLTVEGWNFTKISDIKVTVSLDDAGYKNFKTDSNGYFKGIYQIPAIASGYQTLSATVEDHYITAESTLRVGIMLLMLTPTSGPSGAKVSVAGAGFKPSTAITVKIGADQWFTSSSAEDGFIYVSKNMPTLAPGTYTVTVIEDESDIEITATFTVIQTTKLTLNPTLTPTGCEMTIEGWYFAVDPGIDNSLEFVLYNATSEWVLDVKYEGETVELELDGDWDDGYFQGKFVVPDEDKISIGTYTLNVTDGKGMFAQTQLTVSHALYGVILLPATSTVRVLTGTNPVHTITVLNEGNIADTFTLSYVGAGSASYSSNPVALGVGESTTVDITIMGLPDGKTVGTLTATSAGDGSTDTCSLVSKVQAPIILPPTPPAPPTVKQFKESTVTAASEVIATVTTSEAVTYIKAVTTENAAKIIEQVASATAAKVVNGLDTATAREIIEKMDVAKAASLIDESIKQGFTGQMAETLNEASEGTFAELLFRVQTGTGKSLIENMATQDLNAAAIRVEEAVKKKISEVDPTIKAELEAKLKDTMEAVSVDKLVALFIEIANLPATPSMVAAVFEILDTAKTMEVVEAWVQTGDYESLALVYSYLKEEPLGDIWTAMTPAARTAVFPYLDEVTLGKLPELTTFQVTVSVSPATVQTGQPVTVTAAIRNTGTVTGDLHVVFKEGGVVKEDRVATIAAGATKTETYTVTKTAAGTYMVDVNGVSGTFTVQAPPAPAAFRLSNLAVSPATIQAGQSVTATVRVENTGGTSGTTTVEVKVDGTTVDSKSVTVNPGQSTTVAFTVISQATGSHTVKVGDLTVSFAVEAPPPQPEFPWTLVIAVVVIVAAAVGYYLYSQRKAKP